MIGTTGATGEVGGRVARRLGDRGIQQRLIVRDVSRAPDPRDADVIEFGGYSDGEGMRRAFTGISTLFLVSARETPDRVDQHEAAIDAAVAAGVDRIVYLSFIGAAADATFTFARDHLHTEEHIEKSGLAFTPVFRPPPLRGSGGPALPAAESHPPAAARLVVGFDDRPPSAYRTQYAPRPCE